MLHVRRLLSHGDDDSEMHYLLNTLFLDDYCAWLQMLPDDQLLASAAAALSAATMAPPAGPLSKDLLLPWPLLDIEAHAAEVIAAADEAEEAAAADEAVIEEVDEEEEEEEEEEEGEETEATTSS